MVEESIQQPHVGGNGRRGFEPSRGGSLEVLETAAAPIDFNATRPLQPDSEDPNLFKWERVLSLYGCAVYRIREEEE